MNNTRESLIPWAWAITPLNSTEFQCPGTANILGVFALVNIVMSVLAMVAGNRIVMKKLSCRTCGEKNSSTWTFLWPIQAGLILGGNALCAWINVSAHGFDKARMPRVWDLMLFYCARPRISWFVLLLTKNFAREWDHAAQQSNLAEMVMQILGSYYMGRTAHFAASHGLYLTHHLDGYQHGTDFHLMAGGALLYLVLLYLSIASLGLSTCAPGFSLLNQSRLDRGMNVEFEGVRVNPNEVENVGYGAIICNMMFATLSWVACWLFFAGYTRLAGDL
jgi:hypothetical protein